MRPKMIGLALASMDSDATLSLYHGIADEASKKGYCTQGYVISPSQKSSEEFNANEFFMLETIDYTMYDGLIIVLDTISSQPTREYIYDNIKDSNLPIIAIDCDIPNSIKIKTSNYDSVKQIVNHLIEVHGRSKINYISGPDDNAESLLRLDAFKNAMAEQGLDITDRIYKGTFFVEDGINALDYFENNPIAKDFDAIVCGNDMSAIATICELKKRNYNVPENVSVVGFDDINEATQITPSLTTITKDNEKIGHLAIDLLSQIFDGKSVQKEVHIDASLSYRESSGCGCLPSRNTHSQISFENNFTFSKLFQAYNRAFVERCTTCDSFNNYINILKDFIIATNPVQFSLHIREEFTELFELEDYPGIPFMTREGDTVIMRNVILYSYGSFITLENFQPPKVDFDFDAPQMDVEFPFPAMNFLNSPLHFGDKKIGFVVFANSEFPTMSTIYFNWISSVNNTIYNLYNKALLTQLYRTDSLTDLYNRFGMEYYWDKYVSQASIDHTSLFILFADMNDLKTINDIYGHEAGDHAIELIAKVLKDFETTKIKAIRYGGDEFMLIGHSASVSEIEALIARIQEKLKQLNQENDLPYTISISFGYYERPYDSTLTLDNCIKLADSKMYIQKKAYHESHK